MAHDDDAPRPRIGRSGPPLGHVMDELGTSSRLVTMEAIDADPQRWFYIMQQADAGQTAPMIDIFEDARDRDPRLDGVAAKRTQSIQGRPILFKPPDGYEDDPVAALNAERVSRILLSQSREFRQRLLNLQAAALNGFGVSEMDWRTNEDGWFVPHLLFRHPNRFGFDRKNLEIGFYEGQWRSTMSLCPLSEYPDSFVVHMPGGGRGSYPWRNGAMRSAVVPSFIKRNGLSFWLRSSERFGIPQVYAQIEGVDDDGETSNGVVQTTLEMLGNIASHFAAVVHRNVELKLVPGSDSASADMHSALIEAMNTEIAIRILGQNLTTEVQGGSFAAAETHRFVADDVLIGDAEDLSETITQQIVEPIIRYNWPGTPVPRCEIVTVRKQPLSSEDVDKGLASPDLYLSSKGYPAQPDGQGKDLRQSVTVQVPGGFDPIAAIPGADDVDVAAPIDPNAAVKDPQSALNGAQIDALKSIVSDVALGQIPRDTGIELIVAAFPLSREQAEKIMGSVGQTFEPATEAPPGGAGDPGPFGRTARKRTGRTSQTSAPSAHPLKSVLSSPLDDPTT